ncbi:DUF3180 domain-containing protein [Agromyces aerolatus]|uniref:DUF3180 domain-containing protein n=1 Tax=Agromyces sp. LY-1074 TaxID=3074080 RepID=UPI002863B4AA|nr:MULTISPECIES: DUF3180 domain-containing protein [unclassified Agromyces]MDR5698483.1 DUF3180 domain-containing protein [Agromyces sp. LY-1074]MDR5704777.1 DUF3180 domain-containing protein [Agromyces sp. LY-1358]
MRRTHPSSLIACVVGGVVLGYLGDLLVVSSGGTALVPPLSLPITLVGVAAIVLVLAWPVRRAVTGHSRRRLDPFRAMRIAVLAKASSLAGALVLGLGIGITLFLLTRAVVPNATVVWMALATAIGAALMLAAGLVAEWFCTLPPPDDPDAQHEEHAHV